MAVFISLKFTQVYMRQLIIAKGCCCCCCCFFFLGGGGGGGGGGLNILGGNLDRTLACACACMYMSILCWWVMNSQVVSNGD